MWADAAGFLIKTIFGLMSLAFLLRFYMQVTSSPFRNTFAQTIVKLTDFAVVPVRRVLPSIFKLDSATLLLAFLSQLIISVSLKWLDNFPFAVADPDIWLAFIGLAVLATFQLSIDIFLYAVIVQAILSWVNPNTSIAPLLSALSSPILRLIHRWIPQPSGIDLSPIIVFLMAQLITLLIINPITHSLKVLF
jgi:YggT family protein